MNKKTLWVATLAIFLMFFVFVVVFAIGGVAYNHNQAPTGQKYHRSDLNHYQHLKIAPNEGQRYFGFVSLPQELKEDEYIFKADSNGLTLISPIGSEEFECTGSCFCDSFDRRSSLAISRGVMYLLAASSLGIAFQKAKDFFDVECLEKVSEYCQLGAVRADIDSCERAANTKKGAVAEEDVVYGDEGEDESRSFMCFGNCVLAENLIDAGVSQIPAKAEQCDKIGHESFVSVTRAELLLEGDSPLNWARTAHKKFCDGPLEDICACTNFGPFEETTGAGSQCKGMAFGKNPTVNCRQMTPTLDDGRDQKFFDDKMCWWEKREANKAEIPS